MRKRRNRAAIGRGVTQVRANSTDEGKRETGELSEVQRPREFSFRAPPENARCLYCGYSLHGLTQQRCPECGRWFDPADRRTFDDGRNTAAKRRRLRPVRAPSPAELTLLTVVVLGLTIFRGTTYGSLNFSFGSFSCEWVSAGICTVAIVFLYWRSPYSRARQLRRLKREDLITECSVAAGRWRARTMLSIAVAATFLWPWPAAIRLYLSIPSLNALAARYDSRADMPPLPAQVGLWRVKSVRGHGQGFVWFELEGDFDAWSLPGRFGIARYDVPTSSAQTPQHRTRCWVSPSWCFECWSW